MVSETESNEPPSHAIEKVGALPPAINSLLAMPESPSNLEKRFVLVWLPGDADDAVARCNFARARSRVDPVSRSPGAAGQSLQLIFAPSVARKAARLAITLPPPPRSGLGTTGRCLSSAGRRRIVQQKRSVRSPSIIQRCQVFPASQSKPPILEREPAPRPVTDPGSRRCAKGESLWHLATLHSGSR